MEKFTDAIVHDASSYLAVGCAPLRGFWGTRQSYCCAHALSRQIIRLHIKYFSTVTVRSFCTVTYTIEQRTTIVFPQRREAHADTSPEDRVARGRADDSTAVVRSARNICDRHHAVSLSRRDELTRVPASPPWAISLNVPARPLTCWNRTDILGTDTSRRWV
jgi:hypothetical protein